MDRARTRTHSRRPCINFTENRVNAVPPVVYFRNALWINLSAAIRYKKTASCSKSLIQNIQKSVSTMILTYIAAGNNPTPSPARCCKHSDFHKHSKYFSQPACAREHLYLYLYGSRFSSKACNYIIIQFCSAAYQGRHYSERPLKSLAQPSCSLLPSSPPLQRFL